MRQPNHTRRFLLGQRASKGLQDANLLIALQAIMDAVKSTPAQFGTSEIETSDGTRPQISDGRLQLMFLRGNIL